MALTQGFREVHTLAGMEGLPGMEDLSPRWLTPTRGVLYLLVGRRLRNFVWASSESTAFGSPRAGDAGGRKTHTHTHTKQESKEEVTNFLIT